MKPWDVPTLSRVFPNRTTYDKQRRVVVPVHRGECLARTKDFPSGFLPLDELRVALYEHRMKTGAAFSPCIVTS